jgi:hypothetical protein
VTCESRADRMGSAVTAGGGEVLDLDGERVERLATQLRERGDMSAPIDDVDVNLWRARRPPCRRTHRVGCLDEHQPRPPHREDRRRGVVCDDGAPNQGLEEDPWKNGRGVCPKLGA